MTNTIRNKILDYKDTVNLIYVENEISFSFNTDPCECEHSSFHDTHHKHIITGNLTIAGNSKFRKLLTKGRDYGERRSTNFNKTFAELTTDFDNCNENLASKTIYNVNNFGKWK